MATSLPDCGLGGYAALSLSPCQETITVNNVFLHECFSVKPEMKQKSFYFLRKDFFLIGLQIFEKALFRSKSLHRFLFVNFSHTLYAWAASHPLLAASHLFYRLYHPRVDASKPQ